jgi:hypothetical protein
MPSERPSAPAKQQASVPVALRVGNFTLPSTASLTSAFGLHQAQPGRAHCKGDASCGDASGAKATALRALYLRAALENRFTIHDTAYRVPLDALGRKLHETHILPLIDGTAPTRLPGAKLTSVRIQGAAGLAEWIAYGKARGFFDRLFYYRSTSLTTRPRGPS